MIHAGAGILRLSDTLRCRHCWSSCARAMLRSAPRRRLPARSARTSPRSGSPAASAGVQSFVRQNRYAGW